MFAIERERQVPAPNMAERVGRPYGRAYDGPDAVGSVKERQRRLLDNKGGLQSYRA